MKISLKLIYQYMTIFFNFSPTSNHLHPLQVENCDSNSRLVVDEDDNGKFRLERDKNKMTGFQNKSEMYIPLILIKEISILEWLISLIVSQSINKTYIAPISSADRAQRRTNPLRDHVS